MGFNGISRETFYKTIPYNELQKYKGNCWAATTSVMLRLKGVQVTQKEVTSLFFNHRFVGLGKDELNEIARFFNKYILSKKGKEMKGFDGWEHLKKYVDMLPAVVFIKKHFIVMLGYNDDTDSIFYWDPWLGELKNTNTGGFNNLEASLSWSIM
ncbi:MAG: hypothetical protein GY749_06595 [Desulfobacteraceae bacterium]|nr:hypothetical protein [Desulfobacteraceae bacterium]